jgi:hypothetical protein
MKIILLNGPPGCGKDFGGSLLQDAIDGPFIVVDKFARQLKEACHAAYGIFQNGKPVPHDWFEKSKDEPRGEFFGKTPRQVYIGFSETYMKPMHGPRIFGEMLLRQLRMQDGAIDTLIITDSGFREEAEVLIQHYGAKNVQMIQIVREGHTYDGDSRSYVALADLGVKTTVVHNSGIPEDFLRVLVEATR